MSPWPPEGDAAGKGKEPVTLPRRATPTSQAS
jgi:hypothetical protein